MRVGHHPYEGLLTVIRRARQHARRIIDEEFARPLGSTPISRVDWVACEVR
jgi:hypothetical protein